MAVLRRNEEWLLRGLLLGVMNLIVVTAVQLHKYTKNHRTVHFKRVGF